MDFNSFYIIQSIQLINYVVLSANLLQPLRFSKKKTYFAAFICFFTLYLPQFCFPSFFQPNMDLTNFQFNINIIYWSIYFLASYGIFFFLLKRDWLHNFFLIIVWDVISLIFSVLLSPIQFIIPAIQPILPLIASFLSIIVIQKYLRNRINLSSNIYGVFSIIHALVRIFFTLWTLNVRDSDQKRLLLLIIFILSIVLLSTILLTNKIINHYINKKSKYYWELFQPSANFSSTGWNQFLLSIQKQCQEENISFDIKNHISDSHILKDYHLYYLLVLCYQILLYKSNSDGSSRIYLNMQTQKNCMIISTGCINTTLHPHIPLYSSISTLSKEILLRQLLKILAGEVQFLDGDNYHTQIRIIYSFIAGS